MMLDWLGQGAKAERIEEAVEWSLSKGLKTPDLGGSCSTKDVTEAIVTKLEEADQS